METKATFLEEHKFLYSVIFAGVISLGQKNINCDLEALW